MPLCAEILRVVWQLSPVACSWGQDAALTAAETSVRASTAGAGRRSASVGRLRDRFYMPRADTHTEFTAELVRVLHMHN